MTSSLRGISRCMIRALIRGMSHQHQAAHPGRAARGELLREPAAPGDAQDIGLLVAELVEQAGQQRRQRGQVVGDDGGRRTADAGHVEPDDRPPRIERVDERLEQLQARADAVAQQQRRPARAPSRIETRIARPPIVRILIRSADPTRRSRFSARPRPDPGWSPRAAPDGTDQWS